GRLTATLTLLSRIGTPPTIVGSVLAALTRAVCGSTLMAARVTTVPRLNGPATAAIGIDRPNGPPPYGPVRYTGPENGYGSGPAPAVTAAVPIWLEAGQAPSEACGSPHTVTAGIAPTSPAGNTLVTFARYCWPSPRLRLNV